MYREIEPLIENTRCEERIDDNTGERLSYRIYPSDGYKLHEITLDEPVIDEETMTETDEVKLGFTESFVTTSPEYDFEENPRQIYVVTAEEEQEIATQKGWTLA